MNVVKNLRTLREVKGMSQFELAEKVGLSQQMISFLEDGKRDTRVSILLLLAEALECTPNDILMKGGKLMDNGKVNHLVIDTDKEFRALQGILKFVDDVKVESPFEHVNRITLEIEFNRYNYSDFLERSRGEN